MWRKTPLAWLLIGVLFWGIVGFLPSWMLGFWGDDYIAIYIGVAVLAVIVVYLSAGSVPDDYRPALWFLCPLLAMMIYGLTVVLRFFYFAHIRLD